MSAYTSEVASLILTIFSLKKQSQAPAFSQDIPLFFVLEQGPLNICTEHSSCQIHSRGTQKPLLY